MPPLSIAPVPCGHVAPYRLRPGGSRATRSSSRAPRSSTGWWGRPCPSENHQTSPPEPQRPAKNSLAPSVPCIRANTPVGSARARSSSRGPAALPLRCLKEKARGWPREGLAGGSRAFLRCPGPLSGQGCCARPEAGDPRPGPSPQRRCRCAAGMVEGHGVRLSPRGPSAPGAPGVRGHPGPGAASPRDAEPGVAPGQSGCHSCTTASCRGLAGTPRRNAGASPD